jgi:N-acetylglucosamine-6-phosphate deacetylase
MIALTARRLYTPLQQIADPLVLVEQGRILEVTSRAAREIPKGARVLDFGDAVIVPGFVDIHVHGSAGHDVMEQDAGALPAIEQLLAKHAVTSYIPTTVTAPVDTTLAALERLANAIERASKDPANHPANALRAQPVGIHLEGPFISHARRGVHPAQDLLPPTVAMFDRFWQAARGRIALMTIAPELDGAAEVIAEASRRGVCVSMGHSDADLKSARAGKAAGGRHITHTFNAMRPLDHREPGILGEALADRDLTADIIADGVHLDPIVVELFLKAKGPDAAVLITDATAATGMPDGHYRLGSIDVEVKDGRCMAGGHLAGSVLTMDRAVRNVMQFAAWDLQRAVRLATLNPSRVAGLSGKGRIEAGAEADMVVLSADGEVKGTIVRGVVAEDSSQG